MVENNDISTEIIATELHRNSEKSSPKCLNTVNFESNDKSNESSDENESGAIIARTKKRVRRFQDIDNDSENGSETEFNDESNTKAHSDSSDEAPSTSVPQKSRIRPVSSSGSDTGHGQTAEPSKNEEQQSRIKNKRNELRQKFKSLVSSRGKEPENLDQTIQNDVQQKEKSDSSSSEESSIDKIRQKIKERTMHLKSTIYDPDTSDEERALPKQVPRQKKGRKSAKLMSPKPVRMSAKQAMENMQKIKSESNRMLREKEVSLPYHRPKALSLKDIMSRRRPAVTADGKALPIKMNEEQLKQYAQLLEQRQKEMMELCKSDTEEEDTQENEDKPIEQDTQEGTSTLNDTLYDDLPRTSAEDSIVLKVDDSSKHEDTIATDIQMILDESNKENKIIDKPQEDVENKDKPFNDNPSIEITNALNNDEGENLSTEPGCNLNIAKENEVNSTAEINTSADMVLAYNDSVDENNTHHKGAYNVETIDDISKVDIEPESQLISLYYDSERVEINTENHNLQCTVNPQSNNKLKCAETRLTASASSEAIEDLDEINKIKISKDANNDFSDDDINMEDIDALIENAEIITSQSHAKNEIVNSPMLIGDTQTLKSKPKLTGAPGMVIDLDGSDPFAPKKLSGVELLKERFTFFANLKTPEEMERDREKMIKPGTQHQKLKHDLEEKIAEQRSLEWAKRLEEEKQQQKELDTIRGDGSDAEDDIEKIEAKLEEDSKPVDKESSSESEEEEEDELYEVKEKPVKRNPMIADEAEESDCDEVDEEPNDEEINAGDEGGIEDSGDESEVDSSDDDSESEDDQQSEPKKGRILKAFEDSDDDTETKSGDHEAHNISSPNLTKNNVDSNIITQNPVIKDTQDDELQLAQMHKSLSADLFTSQESGSIKANDKNTVLIASSDDKELGTQTFSILDSTAKQDTEMDLQLPERLTIVCNTQPYDDDNLDTVAGMCSGNFSQNLVPSQFSTTDVSQTQESIGDDVLALCTGKFYDNQFVSQLNNDKTSDEISQSNVVEVDNMTKEIRQKHESVDKASNNVEFNNLGETVSHGTALQEEIILQSKTDNSKQKLEADNTLKSILEELNDPEFVSQKANKYFVSNDNTNKQNKQNAANFKKKFIIDSDDETNEGDQPTKQKKKKRKLKDRALQISDDEEEDQEEEEEEYESEIEHENERVVEYDSEENEVEVLPQKPKKKRKMTEFFEQEAELTSEDEWVGSGDEDEAGLDRMEREAGDDDTFNQGRLQRELEQIHMRDVLDQDKREVRIIQELLFEDGDLGSGHRQRKFRWKNADGEEETGTAYSELADTQEEEFESEEQWRKQRHERETFLKQMQNQEGPDEGLNVTVNRTTIIKANLSSRTMSSLLLEASAATTEKTENNIPEKKTVKDVPSPKKPFAVFQQNYHGSLLTRGRGALARLAALATPLAADDDAPKVGGLAPSSKRNFVFAALTPNEVEPKVPKRKADTNIGTPRLVKKMKTEDQQKYKSRLLEILKP